MKKYINIVVVGLILLSFLSCGFIGGGDVKQFTYRNREATLYLYTQAWANGTCLGSWQDPWDQVTDSLIVYRAAQADSLIAKHKKLR